MDNIETINRIKKIVLKSRIINNRKEICRIIEDSKPLDFIGFRIKQLSNENDGLIHEIMEIEKAEKQEEERNRNRPPATPFKIGGFRERNPDQVDNLEQVVAKWEKPSVGDCRG